MSTVLLLRPGQACGQGIEDVGGRMAALGRQGQRPARQGRIQRDMIGAQRVERLQMPLDDAAVAARDRPRQRAGQPLDLAAASVPSTSGHMAATASTRSMPAACHSVAASCSAHSRKLAA